MLQHPQLLCGVPAVGPAPRLLPDPCLGLCCLVPHMTAAGPTCRVPSASGPAHRALLPPPVVVPASVLLPLSRPATGLAEETGQQPYKYFQ